MSEIMYEERLVAFIDILGFKDMVTKNDMTKLNFIKSVFDDFKNDNYYNIGIGKEIKKEVTWFSDSLVISYPKYIYCEKHFNAFLIINDLKQIQSNLFYNGVLCRGGIAFGNLHHKDAEVIGPALIEAYLIESCNAMHQFPTIKVNEETYSRLLDLTDNNFDRNEIASSFLKHDNTNYYFINFIPTYLKIDELDKNEILEKFKNVIKEGKQVTKASEKYEWMEAYLNSSII